MPRIKFIADYATKEAKPQVFKKDQIVDLPDNEAGRASAQHYLNRNVAVDLAEEEEQPPVRSVKRQPVKAEESTTHHEPHHESKPATAPTPERAQPTQGRKGIEPERAPLKP